MARRARNLKTIIPGGEMPERSRDFIRFLGTAGTRFVMISQRRATGGIWFSYGGEHGVIDPGPGSLVRMCESQPPLSPTDIRHIILTHRHIDHSSDANVMVEAMTLGLRGERRGRVLLTRDCLAHGDKILFKYTRSRVEKIKFHKDGKRRRLGEIATVESVEHRHHGVDCFGVIFRCPGLPTWGLISDTMPLPSLAERYAECEMIVINTSLVEPRPPIDHMAMPDVAELLTKIRPRLVVLSHMGRMMLDLSPEEITRRLSTEHTRVVPAEDGMSVALTGDC